MLQSIFDKIDTCIYNLPGFLYEALPIFLFTSNYLKEHVK